jgi:aminotransferase EvaB
LVSIISSEPLIPFNDLGRVSPELLAELQAAAARVIASGWFVMGPEHEALEAELASYVGVKHAVNVANGTDALELALGAIGVVRDDLVVTVANAGAYTTVATRLLGAIPAYCDIDPQTHLMSAASFEECLAGLDKTPRAVVVTHLYGALAPVADIARIAVSHGILIVEDCAQSLGAIVGGVRGGSLADVATTSFYPTKNLGALGDAGAVFTSHNDVAARLRYLRQYGWSGKYSIEHVGGRNSRMDELQAAILRVKLPLLDGWNARRRDIHAFYEAANRAHSDSGIELINTANESFVGHLAVGVSASRDDAREKLLARGIKTEIHYPIPDHQQRVDAPFAGARELPVTEWAAQAVISLPVFPELTETDVARIGAGLAALS